MKSLPRSSFLSLLGATCLLLPVPVYGADKGSTPAKTQPTESPRTEITSDQMEMQGSVDRNLFYFTGNVHVTGNNLDITCDRLTVVAFREGPKDATVGEFGAVESIVAIGNVAITQGSRTAMAGKAEVDPRAGTVTLSDKPRLKDKDVEVTGYQFVLYKDQKKFVSIPDPHAPQGESPRSKVSLGAIPNLGFDQNLLDQKKPEPVAPPAPQSESAPAPQAAPVAPKPDPAPAAPQSAPAPQSAKPSAA